jgi:hypothetical protein
MWLAYVLFQTEAGHNEIPPAHSNAFPRGGVVG